MGLRGWGGLGVRVEGLGRKCLCVYVFVHDFEMGGGGHVYLYLIENF